MTMTDPRVQFILDNFKPTAISERERESMRFLDDMVEYEIIRNKLELIAQEGRDIMESTGGAPGIKWGDGCTGIYNAQGDLCYSSSSVKVHAVLQQLPVKYCVQKWTDDPTVRIREGDIFFNNEALYGGVHSPDMMLFMPVFSGEELIAWVGAVAHEGETGATEPGGMPPSAKSRYDEGLRVPPLKIGEDFHIREDILLFFSNMVRDSKMLILDTRARHSACMRILKGLKDFMETLGKNGVEKIIAALRQNLEDGREIARQKIRTYNDGTYRCVGFLDTSAREDCLRRLAVSVIKKGDRITLDFTGTSPEILNDSSNAQIAFPLAGISVVLFNFYVTDIPPNAGALDPVDIVVPEGTSLSCSPDTPICNNVIPGFATCPILNVAMSKLTFGSQDMLNSCAPWQTCHNMLFYGGVDQWGTELASYNLEVNAQGQGARPTSDGEIATAAFFANLSEYGDIEDRERMVPLVAVYRNKILKDCHGFGKFRGGAGVDCAFFMLNSPLVAWGMLGFGSKFPAGQGLFGGYGSSCWPFTQLKDNNLLELFRTDPTSIPTDGQEFHSSQALEGSYEYSSIVHSLDFINEGDLCAYSVGGGAGYGDVLEREPEAVMDDLRQQIISHWVARNIYKVAYDEDSLRVDPEKTRRLRDRERRSRIRKGKPFQEFVEEWEKRKPDDSILEYYGAWPIPY